MAVDIIWSRYRKTHHSPSKEADPWDKSKLLSRTNKAVCGLLFQRVKHLVCNIVEKFSAVLINRYWFTNINSRGSDGRDGFARYRMNHKLLALIWRRRPSKTAIRQVLFSYKAGVLNKLMISFRFGAGWYETACRRLRVGIACLRIPLQYLFPTASPPF